MAYVIAEPCIGVKDTGCVDACPVDCIHPKKNTSYSTKSQNRLQARLYPNGAPTLNQSNRNSHADWRPSLKGYVYGDR